MKTLKSFLRSLLGTVVGGAICTAMLLGSQAAQRVGAFLVWGMALWTLVMLVLAVASAIVATKGTAKVAASLPGKLAFGWGILRSIFAAMVYVYAGWTLTGVVELIALIAGVLIYMIVKACEELQKEKA